MVNTRYTMFDPAQQQQQQDNGEPLQNQQIPQDQPEDVPYHGPLPDDSQNFGEGGEYDEDYYEEDGEGYEDHEAENPIDPSENEVELEQEDLEVVRLRQQVLDQEVRMAEQQETTRQMQESLLDLQAFIAAQGFTVNPSVVPPPETQLLVPPTGTGAPNNATTPTPPLGRSPNPEANPSNPAQEKEKAKAADSIEKANPQKKTPPAPKTRVDPGHFPRKEWVNPIPERNHPNNSHGKRP
ncbi:uncharacterized protein LOC133814532 [Humulus lupulus]|uniref:uncharacterized protein LOC133814532 n=1 Tax=Humulus lupulus TaxID=3486 RepID=UPI002B4067C8|nr:uncharacterized protein LOC133814532 [Humulus lupulus]